MAASRRGAGCWFLVSRFRFDVTVCTFFTPSAILHPPSAVMLWHDKHLTKKIKRLFNSIKHLFNFALHNMAYSEKQLQIIEAAEQLFAKHGYGSTSVRQIADAAGVNLAMISYYFGSKEKLMEALVDYRTSHVRLQLENLIKDESLSPLQKVNVMIAQYVERFIERQNFYRIMVTEHILDKNNDITAMLLEMKKRNAALLLQIIREGQKKKQFRKNVDVVMLMNVMVGTVNHALLNKAFYRSFHQLEHMKEAEFNEYLLKKLTDEVKAIFKAQLIYEA